VNQGEREQRHAEKSRDDQRDATEDVGKHVPVRLDTGA
jgi:hypothetical protein